MKRRDDVEEKNEEALMILMRKGKEERGKQLQQVQ